MSYGPQMLFRLVARFPPFDSNVERPDDPHMLEALKWSFCVTDVGDLGSTEGLGDKLRVDLRLDL